VLFYRSQAESQKPAGRGLLRIEVEDGVSERPKSTAELYGPVCRSRLRSCTVLFAIDGSDPLSLGADGQSFKQKRVSSRRWLRPYSG
jgi:hypothetical protein